MRGLFKFLIASVVLASVAAAAIYFVVLPQLALPGPPRDMQGIRGDPARGRYLIAAAGCVACHTDFKNKGAYLAGGAPLKTPFGTFFAPNITPDRRYGIGTWSLAQFARALTSGVSPRGEHYFPSFLYTSYTGMTNRDIADLKSYLDTVAPVAKPSRAHDVAWPFSDRRLLAGWKQIYFREQVFEPAPGKTAAWNRGAYLVDVLGHCGECHTQRNILGGRIGRRHAGNTRGPGGAKVPKLHDLRTAGGEQWKRDELTMALQVGMKPSGDFLGDTMAEVVEHSTGKLTPEDREAMAEYLLGLDQ